MRNTLILVLLAATMAGSIPASADTLGEATRLICSTSTAIVCGSDGECETGPAWMWNIPDFVQVDLEEQSLSTTAASIKQRTTPIEVVRREDGLLLLQGLEHGKAFSVVITEDIGSLSASIILEDIAITVFGACTALPAAE